MHGTETQMLEMQGEKVERLHRRVWGSVCIEGRPSGARLLRGSWKYGQGNFLSTSRTRLTAPRGIRSHWNPFKKRRAFSRNFLDVILGKAPFPISFAQSFDRLKGEIEIALRGRSPENNLELGSFFPREGSQLFGGNVEQRCSKSFARELAEENRDREIYL